MALSSGAALLAACQPSARSPAPPTAVPPAPKPTSAPPGPAAASTTAPPQPAAPAAKVGPAAKDEWVIALNEEATGLDPAVFGGVGTDMMNMHVFDMLVGLEGPDLQPKGHLAERWENPDPSTWRFHLRRGVKFHDGSDFTAEDVKYSIELFLQKDAWRYSYARSIKEAVVRDPYTVDLVTEGPAASLLTNQVRLFVLPQKAREAMGAERFKTQPVGTGAYRVADWQRDQQRVVLEANPSYWRGAMQPKRLVLRVVRDPATRSADLQAGGVDVVQAPPAAQIDTLNSSETEVVAVKGGRIIIFPFNLTKPPFDKLHVRQALNHAIDKNAVVSQVLGGHGIPLAGVFVTGWLGYDPSVQPYPFDAGRARQLLAEAGLADGFEMTWNVTSGALVKDKEIAEYIASQLGRIGVKVNLLPTERGKIQADAAAGNVDGMSSLTWGTQLDPDSMLSWYFDKPHFSLPSIKGLVERGRSELDLGQRTRTYQELYRASHDQAIWLFTHAQDELWAKRRAVPWQPYFTMGSKGFTYFYQAPA